MALTTGPEKSGPERCDELFPDIVVIHVDDLPVVAEKLHGYKRDIKPFIAAERGRAWNEALEQAASSIERSMTGISDGENHVLKQAAFIVRSLISKSEQEERDAHCAFCRPVSA